MVLLDEELGDVGGGEGGDEHDHGELGDGVGDEGLIDACSRGCHHGDGESDAGDRAAGYRGIPAAMKHFAVKEVEGHDGDDIEEHGEQDALGNLFGGLGQVDDSAKLEADEGEHAVVAALEQVADGGVDVAQDDAKDEGNQEAHDGHPVDVAAVGAVEQYHGKHGHGEHHEDAKEGIVNGVAVGLDDAHVEGAVAAGDSDGESQEAHAQQAGLAKERQGLRR